MNILEGLFFGSQVPFDEVNMDCPEYYRACDKVSECRLNTTTIWHDLWKNTKTRKWSRLNSEDFTSSR